MTYQVLLRRSEEGFSVSCPSLPGCWSQGGTEAEALDNIRDAIQGYLEQFGDPATEQGVKSVEVAV